MIWEVNGPKGILKVSVVRKGSKQTHGERGVGAWRLAAREGTVAGAAHDDFFLG